MLNETINFAIILLQITNLSYQYIFGVDVMGEKKASHVIVEKILERLSTGRLKPGDRLPSERELSEELSVSRATLREALSALEIIGIINMRTGDGSYIKEIDIIPFVQMVSQLFIYNRSVGEDLLEVRKLLEIDAIRLIIKRSLLPKSLETLREAVNQMEQSVFSRDYDLGVKSDIFFHKELFVLTGNTVLQTVAQCISSLMERSVTFNRERILRNQENLEVLYNQHHMIYKAILQRDEEVAVRVMSYHLNFVKEIREY